MGLLSGIFDTLGLGEDLFGSGTQTQALSTLTPEQQQYLSKLLPMLYSGATGETTPQMEEYYQTNIAQPLGQYYEETVLPGIRESAGTLHSSANVNRTAQAYSDLANTLAGQKSNLYYQNMQDARSQLLQAIFGGGVENIVTQDTGMAGGLGALLGGTGSILQGIG